MPAASKTTGPFAVPATWEVRTMKTVSIPYGAALFITVPSPLAQSQVSLFESGQLPESLMVVTSVSMVTLLVSAITNLSTHPFTISLGTLQDHAQAMALAVRIARWASPSKSLLALLEFQDVFS